MVKNQPVNAGDKRFDSWAKKISQRKKWQPVPALNGQRSLADYSPQGHKRVRHVVVTKTSQ